MDPRIGPSVTMKADTATAGRRARPPQAEQAGPKPFMQENQAR